MEDEYLVDLTDAIATSGVYCLNERHDGSSKKIFKQKDQMTDKKDFLQSNEGDPELLIYIPFTAAVKMKSMTMIGGEDGTSPAIVKLFVNKEHPDFDLIEGGVASQVSNIERLFRGIRVYWKSRGRIVISIEAKQI